MIKSMAAMGLLAHSLKGSGSFELNEPDPFNAPLKPRKLEKGMTVGVIAPASGAWQKEDVRFAIDVVRSLGFRVKEGRHLFDRNQYLAGWDEERAADVNEMFADPEVGAIFALRGGYGTMRILPMLDYGAIRANPKAFIGFSDITGILNAIYARTGLVGFFGPRAMDNFTEYTLAEFKKVLMHPLESAVIGAAPPFEAREGWVDKDNRVTRVAGGKARGRLVGGNLSLLSRLIGTPYEPDFNGAILFLEDVNEAPYRLDRMLTHLWLAGRLDQVAGIAFGKFTGTDDDGNTFSVEEVIEQRCAPLGVPVISGWMTGHVKDKTTVPLGILAELDADGGKLTLLEPAVG
jgi:muramoyltetrapeptide carboxypeptidase